MDGYLTKDYNLEVADVAEMLGYHPQYIRILAKNGKIPALKRFHKWLFVEQEIIEFLQELTKRSVIRENNHDRGDATISDLLL